MSETAGKPRIIVWMDSAAGCWGSMRYPLGCHLSLGAILASWEEGRHRNQLTVFFYSHLKKKKSFLSSTRTTADGTRCDKLCLSCWRFPSGRTHTTSAHAHWPEHITGPHPASQRVGRPACHEPSWCPTGPMTEEHKFEGVLRSVCVNFLRQLSVSVVDGKGATH